MGKNFLRVENLDVESNISGVNYGVSNTSNGGKLDLDATDGSSAYEAGSDSNKRGFQNLYNAAGDSVRANLSVDSNDQGQYTLSDSAGAVGIQASLSAAREAAFRMQRAGSEKLNLTTAENQQSYLDLPKIAFGTATPQTNAPFEIDYVKSSISAPGSAIYSTGCVIAGGSGHTISGNYNVIAGGILNSISGGDFNFVGGGSGVDIVSGNFSSIVGGEDNDITLSDHAFVGGGFNIDVSGSKFSSSIGGKDNDIISGSFSFIGGGSQNSINRASQAFIGCGNSNEIGSGAANAAIAGGSFNKIGANDEGRNSQSAILGGRANLISGTANAIGGGIQNSVSGDFNGVLGGIRNKIEGKFNSIVGGFENLISGNPTTLASPKKHLHPSGSFIGGGKHNKTTGSYNAIIGGSGSEILSDYSVIIGRTGFIPQSHVGAAIFTDGNARKAQSSGAHTALFDYAGGVFVANSGDLSTILTLGGGIRGTGADGRITLGSVPYLLSGDFNGENANTFLNAASFNTSNGVLTLTKNDSSTVTTDLDGRFALSSSLGTAASLDVGISENNVLQVDATVVDDDFLRINGTKVEGRSASEVLSDIGAQASLTFGISNTNAVKIDSASVADDEFARFTANGLESRSASEVRSDLSLGSLATLSAVDADSVTVTNLEKDNLKASFLVIESEGIASNDNDDTIPTSAAVKDYVDNNVIADTNTFVNSASFNTSNGVLTLTRNDAGTTTVDLDGRFKTGINATDVTGALGFNPVSPASTGAFLDNGDLGTHGGAVLQVSSDGANDNEFLKLDGAGLVISRSASEVLSDIGAITGINATDVTGALGFNPLSAESDTLATITARGNTTTDPIITSQHVSGSTGLFGDVLAKGDFGTHGWEGDPNTHMKGFGDRIIFTVGGLTFADFLEGTQDKIHFNGNENQDIDFRVGYNGGPSIFSRGSDGKVGISNENPTHALDVSGVVSGSSTGAFTKIKLTENHILDSNGEILDFQSNDLIANGKHIRADFGIWARSAGGRNMGIDGNTNFMQLYTNGSEKVRITQAGNVGIGVEDPSHKLYVSGEVAGTGAGSRITLNGLPYLLSGDFNNTFTGLSSSNVTDALGFTPLSAESDTLATVTARGNSTTDAIQSTQFLSGATGLFGSRVGIGTNAPVPTATDANILHVKDGSIKVEGAGTAHGFVLQRAGDDTYEFRNLGGGLTVFNSTDGRREMFFDGDGNVGIGTTAPAQKLQVAGDISGANILASGRIGIGTTAPSTSLDVNGQVTSNEFIAENQGVFRSTSTLGLQLQVQSTDKPIIFSTNSGGITERMRITRTGVGIGTAGTSAKLHVRNDNPTTTGFLVENSSNKHILWAEDDETVNVRQTLNVYHSTVASRYLQLGWGSVFANDNDNELTLGSNFSSNSATRILLAAESADNIPANTIQMQANKGLAIFSGSSTNTFDPSALLDVHGDALISGSIRGTGAGDRITNNGVPYLLSGDVAGEADTLQTVTDRGSTTTTSISIGDDLAVDTDTLFVDASNDNVGIGTASPVDHSDLHVFNAGTAQVTIQSTNNNATGSKLRLVEGGTSYQGGFVHYDGSANKLHIGVHDDGDTDVSNDTNAISIVRSNGRVGIGTESPSEKLAVSGNILITGAGSNGPHLKLGGPFCTWEIENQYAGGANNDMFRIRNSALASDALVINRGNNNVGIGTTNPSEKLDVRGDTLLSGNISTVGNFDKLNVGGGGTMFIRQLGQNHDMRFQTNKGGVTSTALAIDGLTHNVGIGTESPSGKLDVRGDTLLLGNLDVADSVRHHGNTSTQLSFSTDVIDFHAGSPHMIQLDGSSTQNAIAFNVDSNDVDFKVGTVSSSNSLFVQGSDGNVGIHTTSPSTKFHLGTGIARFQNAGSNYIEVDGSVAGANIARISSRFNRFEISTNAGAGDPDISLMPAAGGNVGIGNNAPAQALSISTAAEAKDNNIDFLVANSHNAGLLFRDPAGGRSSIISNTGDDLIFSTNGTGFSAETMRIQDDGKVGIGTNSPQRELQVLHSGVFGKIGPNSPNGNLTVAGYDYFGFNLNAHNGWTDWQIRAGHGENLLLCNEGSVNKDQVLELGKTTKDNAKVYIRSTGAFLEAGMNASKTIPVVSMGCLADSNFQGGAFLDVREDTSTERRFKFSRDGVFVGTGISGSTGYFGSRVGIGVTDPANALQVKSTTLNAGAAAKIENTRDGGSDHALQVIANGSAGSFATRIQQQGGGDILQVLDGSTEVFTILDGGNVGIGTDAPSQKLHLTDGSMRFDAEIMLRDNRDNTILTQSSSSTASNRTLQIGGTNDTTTYSRILFGQAQGDDFRLGVATTQPSHTLSVSGEVAGTGVGNRITLDGLPYLLSGDVAGEADTLQTVTDRGAVTTNDINLNGAVLTADRVHLRSDLRHQGNEGTKLSFSTDVIDFHAGSPHMIQLDGASAQNAIAFNIDSNDVDFKVGTSSSSHSLFVEGSNGKVGIGTNSPSASVQLDTPGSSSIGNGFRLNRPAAGTHYHGYEFATDGTVNWSIGQNSRDALQIYESGADATTRLTILGGGNVGIGTNNPDQSLEVDIGSVSSNESVSENQGVKVSADASSHIGFGGYVMALDNSTADATAFTRLARTAGTAYLGLEIGAQARDGIRFNTHATNNFNNLEERMRINAAGYVGIGTTNPTTKLEVSGSVSNSLAAFREGKGGVEITRRGSNQQQIDFLGSNTSAINAKGSLFINYDSDNDGSNDVIKFSRNGADVAGTVDMVIAEGKVGIGTDSPTNTLDVFGHFSATSKSFLIDHPTKENKRLQYACLEGPENAVYVRGTNDTDVIHLPEYWSELVHDDSITVSLTPIGKKQDLFIIKKSPEVIEVGGVEGSYDYVVYGERKDVDKLEVEPLKV